MAKSRTVFRCMQCGHTLPKWSGQCPGCEEWNTLVEEIDHTSSGYGVLADGAIARHSRLVDDAVRDRSMGLAVPAGVSAGTREVLGSTQVQAITKIQSDVGKPIATGIAELDRVLGGGLVPGSVTLLGGEPGVGKSTLVLQALASKARTGAPVLYVTGEESASQVRLRAERLDALDDRIGLVTETSLPQIVDHILGHRPHLCVIDSIQTLFSPELTSAPGSVAQVRECAFQLVQVAKATATTVVLVGHVTKEGNLAGPRVLEHVVDTVLSFEGDRNNILRTLRAHKHRFGSTDEVGLFTMTTDGLSMVPDPSGLFLGDRRPGAAGSVVTATMHGHRPVLVEVQALASRSTSSTPRRAAQGLDIGRLNLLLAVIDSSLGIGSQGTDIYANAVGGIRIAEPGADLALCLSLVSTLRRIPVHDTVVACGEVGLGGELRQVAGIDRRLNEAARLGFKTALVPASTPEMTTPITVLRHRNLEDAIDRVCLM